MQNIRIILGVNSELKRRPRVPIFYLDTVCVKQLEMIHRLTISPSLSLKFVKSATVWSANTMGAFYQLEGRFRD